MTTGKPPHPPQKTLLGMPSDVQQALKKLQAQKDQQALQARTQAAPPGARSQPAPPSDLERTLYGNPHDSQPSGPSSGAPRPNLPREQPFQPPVRSPIPQQPQPSPQSAHGVPSMQRTMLGMPSDLAAALRQLQERGPASVPAQASRAAGAPGGSSWPPATEAASPWVQPDAARHSGQSVAQPAAAVAHATQLRQQTAVARAAEPALSQPPAASRSGVIQKGATRSTTPPPLTPRTTNASTAPDRERPPVAQTSASQPGRTVSANSEQPSATSSAGQPNGMLATRLVTFEPGVLVAESASRTSLPENAVPGLDEADQAGPARPAPVKRWPALSLLGLAFVAFGGVIAVRAPGLLPAPIAALLVRRPAAAPAAPPPGAAAAPTDQPALSPEGAQPLAAQQPDPAAAPVIAEPAPTGPPAHAVQGQSAELEKQAIDLLLANDYAAARAVYQQLRAAEPARPEYGIMLDLLARELTPTCGGSGQVPCTAP